MRTVCVNKGDNTGGGGHDDDDDDSGGVRLWLAPNPKMTGYDFFMLI